MYTLTVGKSSGCLDQSEVSKFDIWPIRGAETVAAWNILTAAQVWEGALALSRVASRGNIRQLSKLKQIFSVRINSCNSEGLKSKDEQCLIGVMWQQCEFPDDKCCASSRMRVVWLVWPLVGARFITGGSTLVLSDLRPCRSPVTGSDSSQHWQHFIHTSAATQPHQAEQSLLEKSW